MVCCNCGQTNPPRRGKGWVHSKETGFACPCLCHEGGVEKAQKKQKAFEKKHPEDNPKVKDFPKWFQKDKEEKIASQKARAKEL